MQHRLLLGRGVQLQGAGVDGQGALVVAAFEEFIAFLAQLLHGAGLRGRKGQCRAREATGGTREPGRNAHRHCKAEIPGPAQAQSLRVYFQARVFAGRRPAFFFASQGAWSTPGPSAQAQSCGYFRARESSLDLATPSYVMGRGLMAGVRRHSAVSARYFRARVFARRRPALVTSKGVWPGGGSERAGAVVWVRSGSGGGVFARRRHAFVTSWGRGLAVGPSAQAQTSLRA